jgi:hypothetical protein
MYARPNGQTKMTAFWDAAPYSLLEVVRRFKDTASVTIIFLMMEAVGTSGTSVYFNDTTRCYIPESCHFNTRSREEVKSHGETDVLLLPCSVLA